MNLWAEKQSEEIEQGIENKETEERNEKDRVLMIYAEISTNSDIQAIRSVERVVDMDRKISEAKDKIIALRGNKGFYAISNGKANILTNLAKDAGRNLSSR